jgi:DNA invertase Pin-like site-specific DNA recombinase
MTERAIAYLRVSSEDQAESGAGLAAQRASIQAEAHRRGWQIARWVEDAGASGRTLEGRPGLAEALSALKTGQADLLVVAKLDRLTRSVGDFAHMLDRATKERWALVALDLGVDTSTPSGEAMAHVMATFAQLERRLIGQRTKEALDEKRKQGVRLGAPRLIDPKAERLIVDERRAGATLDSIAQALVRQGYGPPRGAIWRHATLRRVLARHSDVPAFPRGRRSLSTISEGGLQ